RARVDDAATCERQPRLPLEPGDFFGQALPQRMRAVGEDGAEEALGIACRDWAVGDPARQGLHLDHRLEPIEAARAGTYDVDRNFLSRRRGAEGRCDVFGPDR